MYRLILFLIIAMLSSGCTDDSSLDIAPLTGTWKWVASTGGIDGRTETPESTGKDILLKITENRVQTFVNGELTLERSFEIITAKSIFNAKEVRMIRYENDWKQSVEIDETRLVLSDECYDCFQNEYVRWNAIH